MPEELSHQPPILLDHGHRGADRAAEVLVTREGLAPEERLEMRPYVFVRIEVGRVARQEVEAQPGAVLVDETARRRRDVRGMPVEHEVDLAAHVVEKRGEEPDEAGRVQGAPIAAEPQAPARADRREHAHTIALSGHPYDGRLSAHAPGAGHRAVLVHARFILEQQRRLALLHLAYHRGELRFSPAATRLVVARERPADGALRRQPEASEQPGDRRLVEHDPEALLDQLGNDGQRPQRKREAELLRRPIDDPPAQLRLLLRRQRRPRPWGDAARQPRIATPPVRAHPLRHRDGVNLEAARHRGLRLAPLENSLHREPPHLLEGRVIQAPRIPRRHHPHHSLVQEHYHNSLCYATMGMRGATRVGVDNPSTPRSPSYGSGIPSRTNAASARGPRRHPHTRSLLSGRHADMLSVEECSRSCSMWRTRSSSNSSSPQSSWSPLRWSCLPPPWSLSARSASASSALGR